RELLDIDHFVVGFSYGQNDFVQLQVDGSRIPVLRVLDEKHHEKGDDGGGRVNDELPCVGIMKVRAQNRPKPYDQQSTEKGPSCPDQIRSMRGECLKLLS